MLFVKRLMLLFVCTMFRYRGLMQTLLKVSSEEGLAGLYGGMSLHLLRAVPNTAIIFLTYEAIISLMYTNKHLLCI